MVLLKMPGVHNAKAEECKTPRIGTRNIKIKIGRHILTTVAIAAVACHPLCKPITLRSVGIHQE